MGTTYTDNYGLAKQENHNDKFDMSIITENMDAIDGILAEKADKDKVLNLSSPAETISDNDDIDNYILNGQYSSIGADLTTISNIPDSENDFELIVKHTVSANIGMQILLYETADIYLRSFTTVQDTTTFGIWKKLTNDVVTNNEEEE